MSAQRCEKVLSLQFSVSGFQFIVADWI